MTEAENTTREKIAVALFEQARFRAAKSIGLRLEQLPSVIWEATDQAEWMDAADALIAAFPTLRDSDEVKTSDWRLDGPMYHFWGDEDWQFVNTSLIVDANRDAVLAPTPEGVPRTQEAYESWQKRIEATLHLVVATAVPGGNE